MPQAIPRAKGARPQQARFAILHLSAALNYLCDALAA
jgi:hypothetical protein